MLQTAKNVSHRRPEHKIVITADEFLLGSAVENILRNAVDYTRPQMTADVSIAESAEAATIVFRDCVQTLASGLAFGPVRK